MSTVVIRVDAGGVIGTGHVMRMIALAQGISRNGAKPIILTAECPDKLVERIAKEKITHIQLADTLLGKTIHVLQEYDAEWLVTDGYHFDFAYQQWIVTTGKKLLCLDDHGYSKNWACDAVLNQNLDAENWAKYNQGDSKKSLQLLLGLKYGLLREEFCGGRGKLPVSKKAPIKKLLITLGGSDPNNITGEILECIGKIDFLNSIEIRVLLGADNQNVKSLKERYSSNAIELLQNVHDMPAQFEWADGVISGLICPFSPLLLRIIKSR